MNHPPPPTRFGPAAAQAKVTISAGLGRAAPPPTKFGPAAAQAKATGPAGPGRAQPVPKFGAPPPVARLFRTRSAGAEAPGQGPWMQTIQPSRAKKDPATKFFRDYQNKSEFDTWQNAAVHYNMYVGDDQLEWLDIAKALGCDLPKKVGHGRGGEDDEQGHAQAYFQGYIQFVVQARGQKDHGTGKKKNLKRILDIA